MIEMPEKDTQRYEIMLNKLGPTTLGFLLELAEKFNAHITDGVIHRNLASDFGIKALDPPIEIPSFSVNPPETKHAGEQTKDQGGDEGLPRPEPGK